MSDKKNPLEGIDPRLSKLHDFAMTVGRKYGRGSIDTVDGNRVLDMPRIGHGSMAFEYALGGGIPRGRISMFYGKKSGGKTSNAMRIMGKAQKLCRNCFRPARNLEVKSVTVERDGIKSEMFYAEAECDCYRAGLFKPVPYTIIDARGKPVTESKKDYQARIKKYEQNSYEELICGWVDTEGTYDKEWATRMGVDNRRVSYYRPETAEEAIDVFDPWVRTGAVDFLVLDTLAFLTPRDEIEKSSEEWQQGLQARLINKFCVDGNARVVTKAGVVKTLSAVLPGDELRSVLNDGRVVWRKVKDIWSNGIRPVVRMKNGLVLTPDHEVVVKRSSESGITFRRADEAGGCVLARLREIADEQVWWERCDDPEPFGETEVFDLEMEWDDEDGEPNFEVGGVFVHNCRKVAAAMSTCARLFNRAPTQIWCNQVRMKIGPFSGEVMPGGMGQGFSTSIEVKFFPKKPEIELVKAGNKGEEIAVPLWVDIAYKVTKNKVASSGIEGFYRMMLSETDSRKKGEIVEDDQIFRWAQHYGLVGKTADEKKWIYRGNEYRTKGEIETLVKSTPEEMEWLKKTLLDLLLQRG